MVESGLSRDGVLSDFRIIDLTSRTAGPVCGQLLADHGAEVIKVERPEGDPARSQAGFVAWNRGKVGIVCDPEVAEDCARVDDLIASADVVLARESELAVFGMGSRELARKYPELIITLIEPLLGDVPWASGEESNGMLAAHMGVAARQSSYDGNPVESAAQYLVHIHGLWAAANTAAALVERESSGFGQIVTVAGEHATLITSTALMSTYADAPDPNTAITPAGRHPTYTRHRAGDGKWLSCGALGPKFELATLDVLGIVDILDDPRMDGKIGNLVQPANRDWLFQVVADAFQARPREDWLRLLAERGVPCGPIDDRREWLRHEQVLANRLAATVTDRERGQVTMPGVPFSLRACPGRITASAPSLGEHNDTVSARVRQDRANEQRAPLAVGVLSGIRVLDMGTFVAAPFAGMLMAELGADVIKVENIQGDPFRETAFVLNRGMRSLSVDLTSDEGRAAFYDLVATSDVVIDALRPGVAEKLGTDYTSMLAHNPDVISVTLSAFGTAGPLAGLPGVDMVVQGMSGMMAAQGGDDGPVVSTIAMVDVTTSAMLVLSSCLALLHRRRAGVGQQVDVSLIGSATYLQTAEITTYDGAIEPTGGGRDFKGARATDRFYVCADGWIRIADTVPLTTEQRRELGIDGCVDAEAVERIGARLAKLDVQQALDWLSERGIDAVRARRYSEIIRDPDLVRSEYVHARPDDTGRIFVAGGRYASYSRTARNGPMITYGNGEHTEQLLAQCGWTPERIDAAIRAGHLFQGGPMIQGLPMAYR